MEGLSQETGWKPLCDDKFDANAATMACRMMCAGSYVSFALRQDPGSNAGYVTDELTCPANATSIKDCTHDAPGTHNCGAIEGIRLTCSAAPKPCSQLPGPGGAREANALNGLSLIHI